MDDNENYLTAYGYDHKPAVIEFKYALDAMENDYDLSILIPNFSEIKDFICFEVMRYKKFVKFMKKQEQFAELFATNDKNKEKKL